MLSYPNKVLWHVHIALLKRAEDPMKMTQTQNYPEKNSPETPVPPLSPTPGGQDCLFSQAGTWHGLSLLQWMSLNASGCAAVYLIIHEELL